MIIEKEKPDVVHFWGTEFLYVQKFYNALKINEGYEEKVVVSIQGLVSVYAKHFDAGIPERVMKSITFSELKGRCSLRSMKKSFVFRRKKRNFWEVLRM